jgi:hypothetical protein
MAPFENFERIVVQRKPHPPIVTDFVACVGCKTMYWAPLSRHSEHLMLQMRARQL